jgi:hypothetical protein
MNDAQERNPPLTRCWKATIHVRAPLQGEGAEPVRLSRPYPPTLGRSQIKLFSQCQKPRNPRPLASACAPTAGTCASSKLIAPPRSTFVSARQQIPRSPSIRVCPCFSAQATSSLPHLNTVQHPFISRAQLPEIFLRRDKYKVKETPLRIGQRHQPIALRKRPPILLNG